MGFFGNILGAAVKGALLPVAIIKDVTKVITDDEPDTTKKLIKSAGKDLDAAMDDITGENF